MKRGKTGVKAKEYLQNLKKLDTNINQKMQELVDVRALAYSVGGMSSEKERVAHSTQGDAPFVSAVEKMINLDAEINREINNFIDEKHKIINQIQGLQYANERKILFARYVEYKSFEQIAVDMNFAIRNIYYLHGQALQSFEKMYLA